MCASRDTYMVPYLIKEDIFSIISLSSKVLQDTLRVDAMFRAQLLPKLHPNYVNEIKQEHFNYTRVTSEDRIVTFADT